MTADGRDIAGAMEARVRALPLWRGLQSVVPLKGGANNSFDAAGERVILETYFGAPPDAALWRASHAMKAASALREAVWGMVSELHLNAPGVDYIAYAGEYLARFERVYEEYLHNHA